MNNLILPGRLGLLAIAGMAAAAPTVGTKATDSVPTALTADEEARCGCRTLWAGQHTDVGQVCLSSDETSLFVDYSLDYSLENDASLSFNEIHTWVGTTQEYPKYPKNPAPGQISKPPNGNNSGKLTGITREYRVTFPLANFGVGCGDQIYFLAHAALSNGESAWAEGDPAPGGSWAMIGNTPVCCGEDIPPPGPPPEEPPPEEPPPEEPPPEEPPPEEPPPVEPPTEEPVPPEGCKFEPPAPEDQGAVQRIDCGCVPENGICSCGGRSIEEFGKGCVFDPRECEIVCAEQDRFFCTEDIFVSSSSGQSTSLYLLNPFSYVAAPVSSTEEFGYDAIGFDHLDGFLYGISNRHAGNAAPRLVRIDRFGYVQDLGTLPGLEGKEWVVGTILEDGTYLIGSFAPGPGSFEWMMIDPRAIAVRATGSIALGTDYPNGPSAWSAHPTNGLVYAHQIDRSLAIFRPNVDAGTLTMVSKTPITSTTTEEIGLGQGCSSVFVEGDLLLYCKVQGRPQVDALFRVDVENSVSTFLSDTIPLVAGDMANCPFHR